MSERRPLRLLGAATGLALAPFIPAAVSAAEHALHGQNSANSAQVQLVDYRSSGDNHTITTPRGEGTLVFQSPKTDAHPEATGSSITDLLHPSQPVGITEGALATLFVEGALGAMVAYRNRANYAMDPQPRRLANISTTVQVAAAQGAIALGWLVGTGTVH